MDGSGNRMRTNWNPNRIPLLTENVSGKLLDSFETNDVEKVSNTFTYNGQEDKSGTWCIQSIDSSSGASLRYATILNNPSYTNYAAAWAARASLTYDLFSVAF
jgi:hypothetical protein